MPSSRLESIITVLPLYLQSPSEIELIAQSISTRYLEISNDLPELRDNIL
ncbi:MAG: hypothetical protein H8E25_00570 [Planctomycetes bacterium]|nr:hypothetical protein [Planctomycetota bacterium]